MNAKAPDEQPLSERLRNMAGIFATNTENLARLMSIIQEHLEPDVLTVATPAEIEAAASLMHEASLARRQTSVMAVALDNLLGRIAGRLTDLRREAEADHARAAGGLMN